MSPTLPGVALLVPALNEEQGLARLLAEVPRSLFAEIFVVDNGSTDRTAEVVRQLGARVASEPRRGYGRACQTGLAHLGANIDVVVFMDADGSDVPSEVTQLLTPIFTGQADLVLGSRHPGRAEPGALLWHQRFGNRLATSLIRLFFGFRYTDLGPFRAIRRAALEQLQMRDTNFGWTVEMQVKALRHGLRILEVPVSYRRRIGQSKISGTWSGSLRAGLKIVWTILRLRVAP